MTTPLLILLGACLALGAYTYLGYPGVLLAIGALRRRPAPPPVSEWPSVSITIPVHNEEAEIPDLMQSLLAIDYPPERRQILVVSDASTDRTDELVGQWADRGIELLVLPQRQGKTVAETVARPHLRGEIVVNTDASVRIHPAAVKRLVAALADPGVAVASGNDISVTRMDGSVNAGESRYVGYEMWVRALETRVAGIVGSSGCLYAIRARLHGASLAAGLSRDFASALIARLNGFRAVSVPDAICYVPRIHSVGGEYRRKVRTITRGLQTLWNHRTLMNPVRYGLFAVSLVSHKLCRWLTAALSAVVLGAMPLLVATEPQAAWFGALVSAGVLLAAAAIRWPVLARIPGLSAASFLVMGNAAAVHALVRCLRGRGDAVWEPTRRPAAVAPGIPAVAPVERA